MTNNSNFIKKTYMYALLPNIIGVLGGTVNVFFDGILVGHRYGDVGLNAVNQCLTVYLILCTIGSLIASGASFISANEFGKKNEKEGKRIFNVAIILAIAIGVVFSAVSLLLLPSITSILSTVQTYSFVLEYLRITLIGGILKIVLYVPFFYLRLEGKNQQLSISMLVMTLLNILLDYIFLFVLNIGIKGAAAASVAATAVALIMSFIFLFTKNSNFRFSFVKFNFNDVKNIFKYGTPMALNNILSAAKVLFVNMVLKSIGINQLITTFAIINNLNEFSICIQNGVPQAAGAITGTFFGEKDYVSVKKLLNVQLVTGSFLSIVFGGVAFLISKNISHWFGSAIDIKFAVGCFAVSLLFATINSVMSYYYNAIGKISVANLIVVFRGFVFVAVYAIAFSGMNEKIWLFYVLSEVSTSLLFIILGAFSKKHGESFFYMLKESLEKSGQAISFSVDCSNEMICDASQKIRDFCEEKKFTPKQTMAISLSIEEILTIISSKSLLGHGTMDVRVLKSGDDGIIRIRSGGKRYNPIEMQDDSMDYMGVMMITKLAKKTDYQSTLGINTLTIFI